MKHLPFISFLLIVLVTIVAAKSPQEIEAQIQDLLSKMTLDEKIGQMNQRNPWTGQVDEEYAEWVRSGSIGSFLNAGGTNGWEIRNEFQKVAVEESRLGIPLIFGRDVIHGYQTVLPIPLGQSCTWNPELVEKGARMAALEASADGVHWTFAPMIDITRDPRWGRVAETCGEDPYLTSVLGAAMVRGFQGKDLSEPGSLVACAKHYVGYGAAVGGRDYNTTYIPERQLRNVFLPSFHAAVEAGVGTFMSAFNDINGVPASGNVFTLRTILRDEWKFDGYVVSDWTSMTEMIAHGFCKDTLEVAYKSALAGVDMEMVSDAYATKLKSLVEQGEIDEQFVNEMVANILRVKIRKGLFDHPYNDGAKRDVILSDEHKDIAREAAVQSAVLLKNDGVLPLSKENTVALIGPLCDSPIDQMGTWTMDGKVEEVITPKAAFEEVLGDRLWYAAGLETSRTMEKDGFPEALEAAKQADVIVLILGEEQILSGEAKCRAFLDLPGAQEELVTELAKTGKPIVAVIMAGRPLTFQAVTEQVNAVMYYHHPGTMGGPALADLIFGDESPSGKLTVTFPRTVGQVPIYYSHRNTGRPPSPETLGIPLGTPLDPQGFTSRYLDVDFTPEYVFGYGLSYTTFEYDNLQLSEQEINIDGSIKVSAQITNTGDRTATEVVQCYVRDLYGSVTRPVKELKGFQRVELKSGETKTVEFELTKQHLGFYGLDNIFIFEPGEFHIWIGPNSSEGLQGSFVVVE